MVYDMPLFVNSCTGSATYYNKHAGKTVPISTTKPRTTVLLLERKQLTLRDLDDRRDELLKKPVDLEQRWPVVVHEVDQQAYHSRIRVICFHFGFWFGSRIGFMRGGGNFESILV